MNTDGPRGGVTFDAEEDGERLNRQAHRVFQLMDDGKWHTLRDLERITGYPQASISARIRDLRKARFGAHFVDRKYHGDGLWCYRLTLRTDDDSSDLEDEDGEP